MHDDTALIEARIERFVTDCVTPHLNSRPLFLSMESWDAQGEPVPFAEESVQTFAPYAPGTRGRGRR